MTDRAELHPIAVLVLCLPAVAGCAHRPAARVAGVYAHDSRALVRLDYDNDGDGRIDVRTYMRQGRPVRLEADRDADGIVDRWEYYGPTGALLRIGSSSRRDGREDMWIRLDGARRIVEISTRRDGRIDRRDTYEGEKLIRAERIAYGATGDARVDVIEGQETSAAR